MKNQTIGALFSPDLSRVVLIKKLRPEWQKGKYNFPGGKIEPNETAQQCISREFYEETDLVTLPQEWKHIGTIDNISPKNRCKVEFLTAIITGDQTINTDKDEKARWFKLGSYSLRTCAILPNLDWLIPFALNIHEDDGFNGGFLKFGIFTYED